MERQFRHCTARNSGKHSVACARLACSIDRFGSASTQRRERKRRKRRIKKNKEEEEEEERVALRYSTKKGIAAMRSSALLCALEAQFSKIGANGAAVYAASQPGTAMYHYSYREQ